MLSRRTGATVLEDWNASAVATLFVRAATAAAFPSSNAAVAAPFSAVTGPIAFSRPTAARFGAVESHAPSEGADCGYEKRAPG